MPRISPSKPPGKPGYRVIFRNPYKKRAIAAGLGTRDEDTAKAYCRDIEALCTAKALWQEPTAPQLLGYEVQAIRVFFGADSEHLRFVQGQLQGRPLTEQDAAAMANYQEVMGTLASMSDVKLEGPGADPDTREVMKAVAGFFKRYRELEARCRKLQNRVKALEPENEYLTEKVKRLERSHNLHVKLTVKEAVEKWRPILPKSGKKGKRSPKTVRDTIKALDSFLEHLPNKGHEKLRDIEATHIDDWFASVKGENDAELSPVSRKRMRAYVSTFFTWATRHLKMSENPMANTEGVGGISQDPERIKAIRRLPELNALIDGLEDWPYWRAWVATACLAGLRWDEQRHITLEKVYLSEGLLRVFASKTGRERNVSIEQTILQPILEEHIKQRKAERRKKNATESEASPWLFPSVAGPSKRKRVSSEPGIWSDSSTFLSVWRGIAKKAAAKSKTKGAFWKHGPREWRHTFGTALAMCGWNALQISRAMGNTSEVTEKFYVARVPASKRWLLEW